MPKNVIFVSGTTALGLVKNSVNLASFQVILESLMPAENLS